MSGIHGFNINSKSRDALTEIHLGSSLKRPSTSSPESESDRSPKRLAVVHPSMPLNSSESQPLTVSISISNPSLTRLEDGIIASIADPGIRSTLQF